ncbi:hypothetical protein N657DRAFT_687946 [Parathielavia appendiculata]|uniref:BZIP domain-containing protein n=1 Tax=Parathielavia appendiculata TaxID=2587402 RepID=A0AAN6U7B2_9PEZI|nr:hypothetical protein N657DRAFT_687946 [Parathielavia appendiculata]
MAKGLDPRERNRVAAKKCREKKKVEHAVLQEKCARLQAENKKLTDDVVKLANQVIAIQNELREHTNCPGGAKVRRYFDTVTDDFLAEKEKKKALQASNEATLGQQVTMAYCPAPASVSAGSPMGQTVGNDGSAYPPLPNGQSTGTVQQQQQVANNAFVQASTYPPPPPIENFINPALIAGGLGMGYNPMPANQQWTDSDFSMIGVGDTGARPSVFG